GAWRGTGEGGVAGATIRPSHRACDRYPSAPYVRTRRRMVVVAVATIWRKTAPRTTYLTGGLALCSSWAAIKLRSRNVPGSGGIAGHSWCGPESSSPGFRALGHSCSRGEPGVCAFGGGCDPPASTRSRSRLRCVSAVTFGRGDVHGAQRGRIAFRCFFGVT